MEILSIVHVEALCLNPLTIINKELVWVREVEDKNDGSVCHERYCLNGDRIFISEKNTKGMDFVPPLHVKQFSLDRYVQIRHEGMQSSF